MKGRKQNKGINRQIGEWGQLGRTVGKGNKRLAYDRGATKRNKTTNVRDKIQEIKKKENEKADGGSLLGNLFLRGWVLHSVEGRS